MELERKAKDPSRLMNTRGNSLLLEEKERNKVNKALPRIKYQAGTPSTNLPKGKEKSLKLVERGSLCSNVLPTELQPFIKGDDPC